MPRTRALTKAQYERREVERVGAEVMRLIRAERGEQTFEQLAENIDLSRSQLQVWRKNNCRGASLENVVVALARLGYRIDIAPLQRGKTH